jgi:hypothetical protein
MTPPIILTGMHRSGTSLVASLLQGLGIDMGERLIEADFRNPRGYHEDADFVELQRQMVSRHLPADDGGFPDWGWTESESAVPNDLGVYRDRARALLMARGRNQRPWGWKDPRTTLLLDFWDQASMDSLGSAARFILLYRFPWEVADSVQRLADASLLRHPSYGYRMWMFYSRRLLDFHRRHPDRCLLISTNALLPAVDQLRTLLNDRFGVTASGRPDRVARLVCRELFVSPGECDAQVALTSQAYPETLDLLRELDATADLPATGLWPAGGTFPPASMPEAHARLFLARILESQRERAILQREVTNLRQELRSAGMLGGLKRAGRRMLGWCGGGNSATTRRSREMDV